MKLQLWIGLVELRPLNKEEYGAAGAFTNLVTWACDAETFRSKAVTLATQLAMFVADIENPQPIHERFLDGVMDEAIEDMVSRAQGNPNAIVYGTFHTYPHDQA